MLIPVDQLEESANRYAFAEAKPFRDSSFEQDSTALNTGTFAATMKANILPPNILSPNESLEVRKAMLAAVNLEPADFAFERAIGKNDSVYSNFIGLIQQAKQKTGRIVVKRGSQNRGFATGFMVAENLLLTNWHVFRSSEDVGDSEIQFFYEYDVVGNPVEAVCFKLIPELFFHASKELDYCLVGVSPNDTTGKSALWDIGYLFLDPALGKLGESEEALNIIHHPDGDYMQLSIRENNFDRITDISIWYKTDTAPGSSGSPVFNDQWQVVALHHMGVAQKNEAGEYTDKFGLEIPVINGKIDASKVVWVANEGIRISVILNDLAQALPGHKLLNGLKIRPNAAPISTRKPASNVLAPSPPEAASPATTITSPANMSQNQPSNHVNVSFPASLLESNGSVDISISHSNQAAAHKSRENTLPAADGGDELDGYELKKLEETIDFSVCKGYQAKFLGSNYKINLPQPQTALRRFIAKVDGTDNIVLNYFQYSVIFHATRRMPVISAINVEGNLAERLDKSKRKDVWLRDRRIDFYVQLDDKFYTGSKFNRGHMSRREDANWGVTPEEAKRNADMTCMFTNACPQVAELNQSSRKGLWGKLEEAVLENGASIEQGNKARISVFNGPIFKSDDPVLRGVQVPMDFFKIVLWLTDNSQLKATAFKLTQTGKTNEIDFEQLDINENIEFKEYQCSISSLQIATQIDFSELLPYDTFDDTTADEVEIVDANEIAVHISKHSGH
jgi:endonuclease G